MRAIRRFLTMLKQGIKGIWKHKSMGFASIISIIATLFVLGVVLIVTITANNIAKDVQTKVDEVEIFLKQDVTATAFEQIEQHIAQEDAVDSYTYRSSTVALEYMKQQWGDDAYILEGLENETEPILEASFIVKLKDIGDTQTFVDGVKNLEGVSDVTYYQDLVEQVLKISNYIRLFGMAMVLILVIVSLFIIWNTVKLTVVSRAREISVMKYVGATNHMIRGPFIIEGVVFGLIGSALAFLAVYALYSQLYYRFGHQIYEVVAAYLIEPILLRNDLLVIFLSLGTGIGMLGSAFSVSRHVKVNRPTTT